MELSSLDSVVINALRNNKIHCHSFFSSTVNLFLYSEQSSGLLDLVL